VGVVAYLFTEVPFCPQELGSKERGRRKSTEQGRVAIANQNIFLWLLAASGGYKKARCSI
jgi:hypothetical protein